MGFYDNYVKEILYFDKEENKKYNNRYFRNYLINFFLKRYELYLKKEVEENEILELLEIVKDYLKRFMLKPQRVIEDNEEYYIGKDIRTNTKYICFKNLCVLDFDINKNNFKKKEEILEYIERNELLKEIPYNIIETRNGYHIYILDKKRLYNDIETFKFLMNFESDIYYKFYCIIRGYSIRLNKKEGEEKIKYNIRSCFKKKKKKDIGLYNLFMKHLEYFEEKGKEISMMK
jgi:hypothetical protein